MIACRPGEFRAWRPLPSERRKNSPKSQTSVIRSSTSWISFSLSLRIMTSRFAPTIWAHSGIGLPIATRIDSTGSRRPLTGASTGWTATSPVFRSGSSLFSMMSSASSRLRCTPTKICSSYLMPRSN